MRAVRWHARRDIRLEELPDPPAPGPGEIGVRVAWCGLCGSDVHEYRSGPFQIPLRPHPVTGRKAPIVLGHEVSGWVERIGPTVAGPAVAGPAVGELVSLNGLIPCHRCPQCRRQAPQRCLSFGHIGMSADGGLADRLTVPAEMVVAAPPGTDPELAALAEPFAVATHAIAQADRPADQRCLVLGAGTIGLATALVLREAGNTVTVLDIVPERIAHASALGLAAATDARAAPAAVVFECSGASEAPATAIRLAEPGGLVVFVGLPEKPSMLDVKPLVLREVRTIGAVSHRTRADLVPALGFLAAHPDSARRLITARIPLEATVPNGIEVLASPAARVHGKILVRVAGQTLS
ncbi:MAG TPA: alcohol dehydrogenase catalytic domain-containing protein [Actinoplanes sp.]|jgi:(R,R)-butanediol dehydrogenase/meso-butanediol dehydrogenase/diacetyl reductase